MTWFRKERDADLDAELESHLQMAAEERIKLFKLAWDLLGSDFGGRHLQYERFYMGPAFVVRSHASRECPWQEIEAYTDRLLGSYEAGPLLDSGRDGRERNCAEPGSEAAE